MNEYLNSAHNLYQYILNKHWNGNVVVGPDPIGKIHWRVTRFVRSYLGWLPGDDQYIYLQGQGYWIRANLALYEITNDSYHLDLVAQAADFITEKQFPSGAWEHPPIPGRKGFISTVETVWACIGLISAYRKLEVSTYLDAALKGYEALVDVIGFRSYKDGLAVNYYAHSTSLVPNVTTMSIWLMSEIFEVTQDKNYLSYVDKMIRFLEYSHMESGELEYAFNSRPHFQCYQYNAFQFLDMTHYFQITKDEIALRLLSKLAGYLATGVTARGSSFYNCFKEVPEVNYWTGALANALLKAYELGLGEYLVRSEQLFQHLRLQQRSDGSFDFSSQNYRVLRDVRSYPRYLAMILDQLLSRARFEQKNVRLRPLLTHNNLLLSKDRPYEVS